MKRNPRRSLLQLTPVALMTISVVSCGQEAPAGPERYSSVDALFDFVKRNVEADPALAPVVDIDHSRLGAEAGSVMPPAHVLIYSAPGLQSRMVAANQLVAIDLPLRVLAYEDPTTGEARLIANRYAYVAARYGLDDSFAAEYEQALTAALARAPAGAVAEFESNTMPEPGIVTFESDFAFEETERRVLEAINAQDDTVYFGTVDFAAEAASAGMTLRPTRLILFGGPGPGATAMADAPTLGLDAFCQKLLIWEDEQGQVRVSFNDLLALAERQGPGPSIPLRVINRRLASTFSEAVTRQE